MFVLHWLFLFVVTFNIALSNSVFNDEMYKKKTLILRKKFQQLIVSNCVSYCYSVHDDDPRAQMLGRCQVTINIHFCQFLRIFFSESGTSISEILCQ